LRINKLLWIAASLLLFVVGGFWVPAPQSKDDFSFWGIVNAVLETGQVSGFGLLLIVLWAAILAGASILGGLVVQYAIVLMADVFKERRPTDENRNLGRS